MYITQKSTDDYTYKPKTIKNNYGINSTSLNDKPKAWKNITPSQSENGLAKNPRVKLYNTSGSNSNVSVPKRDYLTSKLPDFTANTIKRPGSIIKDNIKNVLSKKYGELDVRHLFDDIDDTEIENNILTAENTIQTNINKGYLSKDIYSKLPNLRDGLALSYAAANKGRSKAATRAREAGYTEQSPLKASDIQPKSQPTKYSNFYTDYLENKKTPQSNNSWNIFGKTNELPGINKNPRYVNADVLNMRSAPGMDSKIVGGLPDGTEVHYTGNKTEEIDGHLWAEVTYDGKTGWVAADYLRIAKPDQSATQNSSPYNNFNDVENIKTGNNENNTSTVELKENKQSIDWTDPNAVRNEFNKEGNHGNMQCADLSKWVIDKHTDLKRPATGNNGNVFAENIAKLNGLETTHTPCAPAIFSVKEGTYGPGINPSGVSHNQYGHTGIALAVKDLGNDMYEITYIDTYQGYNKDGYNSNVNTRTFKMSNNVTYVSLEGHLK